MKFEVTQKHCPPVRLNGCGWCKSKLGESHEDSCVLIRRTNTYVVYVDGDEAGTYTRQDPASWDQGSCEFHKNQGSWCVSNALDSGILSPSAREALYGSATEHDCACSRTTMALVAMGVEVRCDS